MKSLRSGLVVLAMLTLGFVSCKKEKSADPVETRITKIDSLEIPFSSSFYTFYSFKDSSLIPATDSATNKWDFALRSVNIIVNSLSSGPGNVGVLTVVDNIFDTYLTAPTTGYVYDTASNKKAIDASMNTGWYNYDRNTHAFSPKAGRFFIFKTTDGHYVKFEITSVEYGGYAPGDFAPTTLIYKFRYVYQKDGSQNF